MARLRADIHAKEGKRVIQTRFHPSVQLRTLMLLDQMIGGNWNNVTIQLDREANDSLPVEEWI